MGMKVKDQKVKGVNIKGNLNGKDLKKEKYRLFH